MKSGWRYADQLDIKSRNRLGWTVMKHIRLAVLPFLAVCLLMGCSEEIVGGKKYPVEGQVLIGGQPRENVTVQFWHQDPSVEGNDRHPTGMTDTHGRFRLSSYQSNDGAVPGEYKVTFNWMSSLDLGGVDLLRGLLGDPDRSPYLVTIEATAKGNQLQAFELEVPESILREAERRLGQKSQ